MLKAYSVFKDLDTLLTNSDIITVNIPLNEEISNIYKHIKSRNSRYERIDKICR